MVVFLSGAFHLDLILKCLLGLTGATKGGLNMEGPSRSTGFRQSRRSRSQRDRERRRRRVDLAEQRATSLSQAPTGRLVVGRTVGGCRWVPVPVLYPVGENAGPGSGDTGLHAGGRESRCPARKT